MVLFASSIGFLCLCVMDSMVLVLLILKEAAARASRGDVFLRTSCVFVETFPKQSLKAQIVEIGN